EDAVVIGVVLLTLYAPSRAVIAAGLAAVVVSPLALSLLRAFEYAVLLIVGRIFVTFRQRRWRSFDELPAWASASLEGDDVFAPGGALRGTPAGAYKLPGGPRYRPGASRKPTCFAASTSRVRAEDPSSCSGWAGPVPRAFGRSSTSPRGRPRQRLEGPATSFP
ncbi:MAG: hypothetical protein AMS19_07580, partial [Gemmatimonas sp. SG8_23]